MARLKEQKPDPAAVERPQWLQQFSWLDWDDPTAPMPREAASFNGGTHADPAEVAWFRRVLAARHRWNEARERWFFEHGEAGNGYRVRLTGETPDDIDEQE